MTSRIECPKCGGTGQRWRDAADCDACYGHRGDIAPRVQAWAITIPVCAVLMAGIVVLGAFVPQGQAVIFVGPLFPGFLFGMTWSDVGSPLEVMQLLKEARENERAVDKAG